jgi:hypothetical protein
MAKEVVTDQNVLSALRKRIVSNGLRATARDLGFSAPYIGDVRDGSRSLSEAVGVALGFMPIPPPPAPPRQWKYAIGNSCTSKWERDNYPQVKR